MEGFAKIDNLKYKRHKMKILLPLLIAWLFIGCAASSKSYDGYQYYNTYSCDALIKEKAYLDSKIEETHTTTFSDDTTKNIVGGVYFGGVVGGVSSALSSTKNDALKEKSLNTMKKDRESVEKYIKDKNCTN